MKRLVIIACVLASVLASGSTAVADKSDKADKLFQKGKKLLGEKKYADACPAFEQSDKLDPGIGTKLNVAKCYEEWGRLATAYHWYEEASEMAAAAKDDRTAKIKTLMSDLDGNVPRLTIRVPAGADPQVLATVTLDDKPVASEMLNAEQRIDPGPHAIEFRVEGKKRKKMAPVERGSESEVSLDIPSTVADATPVKIERKVEPKETPTSPSAVRPGRTRRIVGITVASLGVVAVGVAGIVTLGAKSKYNDAIDDNCMGSTSMCNDIGLADTKDARSTANTATVVTLVGVAAIATGVILYVTAPSGSAAKREKRDDEAMYFTPVVDGTGGGFVVGGAF